MEAVHLWTENTYQHFSQTPKVIGLLMSEPTAKVWLERLHTARDAHVSVREQNLCCLFEELVAAYSSAVTELDSVKMALNRAIKDRDGYAADCAILRSALIDDMWKESP